MKKHITILFVLSALICQSQTVNVSYSETIDISDELKDLDIPEDAGFNALFIKQLLMEKVGESKHFELTACNGVSIYRKKEIDKGNDDEFNISVSISGSGEGLIYKDLKENKYIEQTEFMSRTFLINDQIPEYDWKIGDEEKKIGKYNCKKATSTKKDTVIAWYTNEIPVSIGPKTYGGLPGIIVKVINGPITIEATEIKTSNQKLDFERPTKGKEVSQEEFNKIQEKKAMKYGNFDGEGTKVKVITM